jgi:hypothetical protein
VLTASVIRAKMEAVGAPETSVGFWRTKRHIILEDCYLHSRRHDNMKSVQIVDLKEIKVCGLASSGSE